MNRWFNKSKNKDIFLKTESVISSVLSNGIIARLSIKKQAVHVA